MTDIFQEVEEDVRRERYEQIWKKYGHFIIGGVALVILAAGGYQAWTAYDRSQREASSDQFRAAETLSTTGQNPKSETAFAALAKDGTSGYATLAKFRLAGIFQNEGKRAEAIKLLRELTSDSNPVLANTARLRLGWTLAETAPRAEIETLLAPLREAGSPWKANADEVFAYLDLQAGSRGAAQAAYEKLAQDTTAPQGLRQRAGAVALHLKATPVEAPVPEVSGPAASTTPQATIPAAPAAQETKPQ